MQPSPRNKKKNDFEKDLDDLNEWQENQYNPGYFIGSGRVPRPLLNLTKYPWIFILLGILSIISVIVMMAGLTADPQNLVPAIPSMLFGLGISGALLYGGIAKLKSNRHSKTKK